MHGSGGGQRILNQRQLRRPVMRVLCPTKHMIAQTIADELRRTAADLGSAGLYAFTLIQGQQCNYLGYAVATEAAITATTAGTSQKAIAITDA